MSKTKSKKASKKIRSGAVRKMTALASSRQLKLKDRVRIVDIAAELKGLNYDSKSDERQQMRTAELFRFCIGREFEIRGFDRYGHAELHVGENLTVRRKFGRYQTIWMETEFLEPVKKRS